MMFMMMLLLCLISLQIVKNTSLIIRRGKEKENICIVEQFIWTVSLVDFACKWVYECKLDSNPVTLRELEQFKCTAVNFLLPVDFYYGY